MESQWDSETGVDQLDDGLVFRAERWRLRTRLRGRPERDGGTHEVDMIHTYNLLTLWPYPLSNSKMCRVQEKLDNSKCRDDIRIRIIYTTRFYHVTRIQHGRQSEYEKNDERDIQISSGTCEWGGGGRGYV